MRRRLQNLTSARLVARFALLTAVWATLGGRAKADAPVNQAQPNVQTKNVYVGLGVYSEALAKYTAVADGRPALFSVLDFPVAIGAAFPISDRWRFVPLLYWNALLPRALPDGHGAVETLLLRSPFALTLLGGAFEATFGVGLQIQRIYGDGRAVMLNDGTSTGTFSAPGGSRLTALFLLETGIQKEWRGALLGLTALLEAPLNERRRTFGLLATATFRVWEFN